MRKVIFYFSPCGGTKAVADIINKEYGDVLMQELTTPSMDVELDANTLAFFCFPVYGGRIPKPMYERMKQVKGNKTPCVHVAVYGNRAVDDALLEMQELTNKYGFVTVGGCEMIAPHSVDPSFAADRPDASDVAKMKEFLKKLDEKETLNEVRMPGDPNYAKRKANDFPLYPKPSKECIGCGICYKYCPAGAINAKRMKTNKRKCISCMRCVSMCSTESRNVSLPMRVIAHAVLKKTCSDRKEPKFYL